ncbi:MAG: zf-HC2 domain-containing protein, partial [Planctomycetes bacterium]|nr:zf-HC2 domain-containing protein [Planctomycetota bacterium]
MPSRKKKPAAEKRSARPRGSGRPGSRAAASGARSPAAGARAAPPRRKTAASAQTQTPPPAPTPRAPLPGASDRLEQRAHTASRQSAGRRAEHLGYLLTAYILENISADGRREVESHVEECGECRRELAELRRTLAAVEDVLAPPAAGRGGEACAAYSFEERRLRRVLAASRQRPAWRRGIVIACSSAAALIVVVLGLGLLLSGLTEKKAYRLADGGARRYEAELAGRHDNTPGVWSESSHGEDSSAPPYVRGRAAAKYGQDPEAPGKMEEDAAAQEISPADGPAGAAGEEPARKRVARGFAIAPPADSGADELSVKPERLDLVASAPAAEEAPAQEGEGAMVTVESRFLDEGDVAVEAEEIAEPAEERIIFGADVDDDGVVFGEDEDVLSDLELEAPRQEAAAAGTGVAGKPLAAPRPPPPTARAEDPAARAASGRVQQLAKGLKSSSSAVRGPAAAATATPAPTPAPPAYDPTVQRDMSRTTGGRAGRDRGSVAGGGDVTVEIPKGADLEKMSNFNLNADSIKEAIRAGGEAAGAARNFDFAIKRSETRSIQDLEEKPGTTQAGDDLSYLPRLQDRLQNLQNGQTTLYGNGRVLHRARQDVDLLAAHRGIELSREGEPPPPVSAGIAPEAASSLERSLRAYAYYNSLSPSLTLEQFRA